MSFMGTVQPEQHGKAGENDDNDRALILYDDYNNTKLLFFIILLFVQDQPVDHFMRTFYNAADAGAYWKTVFGHHLCLGSLPVHVNMLNYMKDFADVYKSRRKFSFLFHNDLTHPGVSLLFRGFRARDLNVADDDLKDFLVYLNEHGHLDNTLLILLSDHGARFQVLNL